MKKILFFGCTKYSFKVLKYIYNNISEVEICGIFTIPEYFNISYSKKKVKNYTYSSHIKSFGKTKGIKVFEIDSKKGEGLKDRAELISSLKPDVIIVYGWYYMIPKIIRDIPKYGCWGIHQSLLPKYSGGAPLSWAIINGEEKTGVTLFRMEDGVDDGDIISQQSINILKNNTIDDMQCKSIYTSYCLLSDALANIDSIKFTPQRNLKDRKIWPQRKPEDGEINLGMSGHDMYNFIRAQAPPYPGAFIKTIDNKKIIIEKARIEEK